MKWSAFEELVFVNKAKVMFKVTQGISPIYITEMSQIKGCNNEDTINEFAFRFKQKI